LYIYVVKYPYLTLVRNATTNYMELLIDGCAFPPDALEIALFLKLNGC
jgi:hypothetical protein